MAGALRLGQDLPLAVFVTPATVYPPCYHKTPPLHYVLFANDCFRSAPYGHDYVHFFRYARSTLWTSRLFLPPVHNSNGQRPLLVLTGLEDLGFAHSAVTQLFSVQGAV